jgi:uncharacterized beta-barrel protein YwiB (DUF1934 family)
MFWLPNETEAGRVGRACKLMWTRKTAGSDEADEAEQEVIEGAVWRHRGHAHYLSYEEPMNGQGSVRTTLRVEPDALTWVRHGVVTWTHSFREGEQHASRLMLGQQSVNVETSTEKLVIEVQPNGGHVALVYDMQMAQEATRVELTLHFQANTDE